MPKTITLTRPNGLKFEVMVDEIYGFEPYDTTATTRIIINKGSVEVIGEGNLIQKLIAEAKKEDELCPPGAIVYKIDCKQCMWLKKELEKSFKLNNELWDRLDRPKTTTLTREEMLKAIDEGKTVREINHEPSLYYGSWNSNDSPLNKDTLWEIVE